MQKEKEISTLREKVDYLITRRINAERKLVAIRELKLPLTGLNFENIKVIQSRGFDNKHVLFVQNLIL